MSQTTDAQNYFSEGQVREEFSAQVLSFNPPQLARMSGCSTDATRRWIDGSRGPNTASVINIARRLPAVQTWLADRAGYKTARATSIAEVLMSLSAIADRQDSEGAKARMILIVARSIDAKVDAVDPRLRGLHEAVEQLLPEWVR